MVVRVWMDLGVVRSAACGACALLAACGSGRGGPPDASIAQTITVRVDSPDPLRLIAFRDGPGAPWQIPAATEPGTYDIVVHGPYTVLEVCTPLGIATTMEKSRTLDDLHELDMPCGASAAGRVSHVTGTMTPLPGAGRQASVYIGQSSAAPTANGHFDIEATDGTYDLIARTGSAAAADDRIAIRRNLVVAGDTVVTPTIDVEAEGTATVAVRPVVSNLAASETLTMGASLITPSTVAGLSGAGEVPVLPDAALGPRDIQQIDIVADSGTSADFSARITTRRYTEASSLAFDLPPAIATEYATVDGQAVARWTALPALDFIEFGIVQEPTSGLGIATQQISNLSASYVAATRVTSAALDTDVPGYDQAWRTKFDRALVRGVNSGRTAGDDVFVFLRSETIDPGAVAGSAVPRADAVGYDRARRTAFHRESPRVAGPPAPPSPPPRTP